MTESSSKPSRRKILTVASRLAMAGGLIGGYGAFGAIATRYLYPAKGPDKRRFFVGVLSQLAAGQASTFIGPSSESIVITRHGEAGDAEDFIALSSVCPHLGCQVHWQAAARQFFCPCHNGAFDPTGKAIAGPPQKAGQSLARYPLVVEQGLLYIEIAV